MKMKRSKAMLVVLLIPLISITACTERNLTIDQLIQRAQKAAVKGKYARAIEYYQKALQKEGDESKKGKIVCEMGLNFYQLGRYQDTIKTIEVGLKYNPDYSTAHGVLGLAYYNLAPIRFKDKIKLHLGRYIELEPEHSIVAGFENILWELELSEEERAALLAERDMGAGEGEGGKEAAAGKVVFSVDSQPGELSEMFQPLHPVPVR